MINRLPEWLRQPLPVRSSLEFSGTLSELGVNTVCREAACPNTGVCFSKRQLSFLILGRRCTRRCAFCDIALRSAERESQDRLEPGRVAAAVSRLGIKYAVITSVTRDDLPDGGASVFAASVRNLRESAPGTRVELLIPDFGRSFAALDLVLEQKPEVIGHNIETVPALFGRIKPGSDLDFSLAILRRIKMREPGIRTKSSLMLGMGENTPEVLEALRLLKDNGCDMVTLGQYIAPSGAAFPVAEFVAPERFRALGEAAREIGFKAVFSGPLVRSSFMAETLFKEAGSA